MFPFPEMSWASIFWRSESVPLFSGMRALPFHPGWASLEECFALFHPIRAVPELNKKNPCSSTLPTWRGAGLDIGRTTPQYRSDILSQNLRLAHNVFMRWSCDMSVEDFAAPYEGWAKALTCAAQPVNYPNAVQCFVLCDPLDAHRSPKSQLPNTRAFDSVRAHLAMLCETFAIPIAANRF